MAQPRPALARICASGIEIEPAPCALLAHKVHSKVRVGKYYGMPTALLSFRSGPESEQLWRAAVEALETHIAPHSHLNLVQVYGIVTDAMDSTPTYVVSEYLSTSLYSALHCERLSLTRSEVARVAIDVLHALQFLHDRGESFGATLTSRKVMLGGATAAKLRRFGVEFVQRAATANQRSVRIPETTSFWKTHDEALARNTTTTQQQQDMYAFGMLLLEMCTGAKPDSEIVNCISCAEQLDPVFGRIVRSALGSDGCADTGAPRRNESLISGGIKATAACFLALLTANEQQRASELTRLSTLSFASFVHADRYYEVTERQHIDQALAARDSHLEVATKRLSAVEHELVEEQSNFEVLVRQFETAQLDNQQLMSAARVCDDTLERLRADCNDARAACERLTAVTRRQRKDSERLHMLLEESRACILVMQDAKHADRLEKQALLNGILKLKDEKRRLQDEKRDVEAHAASIAATVGAEKDAVEDLDGRLRQVTFKWQQEQLERRKLERQIESLSSQLAAIEDERSQYAFELNCSPTGVLDPKQTAVYVLELKEKELECLRARLAQQMQVETELQLEVERQQRALQHADEVQTALHARANALESQHQTLRDTLDAKVAEASRLKVQIHDAEMQIQALTQRIADYEDELERQAKKRADEETARRKRQCLTPQCDAPRYLIGSSGYCAECEENAATQRAAATASRRNNNIRNAPVVELIRAIDETTSDHERSVNHSSEDSEVASESLSTVLALVKQLTAALKADETLKDDLPECRAFKTLLATMKLFCESLALQLECCKCLSVAVFGHDRNRIIVVADGVVEAALGARTRFARDEKLLDATSVLLTNLSHNCESNRKRILDAGGVDAVLEAMQLFPQRTNVQKKSCWALLTLAGSDMMCHEIAARGGLGAILAGMLNCPADEHVQYYGARALVNLVSGATRLQHFARREGVVEVAEAALACFPDHAGIQAKARELLLLVAHERT